MMEYKVFKGFKVKLGHKEIREPTELMVPTVPLVRKDKWEIRVLMELKEIQAHKVLTEQLEQLDHKDL
jgi:hypothetical protein